MVGHTLFHQPKTSHPSRTSSSNMSRNIANNGNRSGPEAAVLTPDNLSPETVAALPPPGLTGPTSIIFSPKSHNTPTYMAFLSSTSLAHKSSERQLCVLDVNDFSKVVPLISPLNSADSHHYASSQNNNNNSNKNDDSLEERLRRERQRLHSPGATQFSWVLTANDSLQILVPLKGNLYVQQNIGAPLQLIYDKQRFASSSALGGDNLDNNAHSTPAHINNNGSTTTTTTTGNNTGYHPHTGGSIVGRDTGAIDPQLSPDGRLVAFCVAGELYVIPTLRRFPANSTSTTSMTTRRTSSSLFHPATPIRLTYGATQNGTTCITHGLADFVAQEEMDRYRGFWWHPDSNGILFSKVDETHVPTYVIHHQGFEGTATSEDAYENHRYPFAGQANPIVTLGFIPIDTSSVCSDDDHHGSMQDAQEVARDLWEHHVLWFPPPALTKEYLARVSWFPDKTACVQWQNRTQTILSMVQVNVITGIQKTLLLERSDVWINLHHMMHVLPRAIHPEECPDAPSDIFLPPNPLPEGSFSFLYASERTGFMHLYLYTYVPNMNNDRAICVRAVSGGDWIVESIVGVDLNSDAVYVSGTYDSPLERHLYALSITGSSTARSSDDLGMGDSSCTSTSGMRRSLKSVMSALSGGSTKSVRPREATMDGPVPIRLTAERGMHGVVMDADCKLFVDTSSDLGRPTTVKIYRLPEGGPFTLSNPSTARGRKVSRKLVDCDHVRLLYTLYNASNDDKTMNSILGNLNDLSCERLLQLPSPELLSFPTTDGTETLHAALYRPDPRIHGPGPYPLVCAVYGGPHVQRVNRSWSQCCDMRAQRLRSLGFCVVKCDNRGSSRRGLSFEGAIQGRLGRLEVLDQVAAVRHLVAQGICDPTRVGIYGWSYGGYLAAMCLCRAPDVFHAAVAGAPVTSWDGYDTHYTERYMGLPADNPGGYRESAVFDHIPNMRGKLMLVHGLIDENVHFRHTARLINRLIASQKDYDLLVFPDERHSPRRLRDRIYMEQRISDFFTTTLAATAPSSSRSASLRPMPGHL